MVDPFGQCFDLIIFLALEKNICFYTVEEQAKYSGGKTKKNTFMENRGTN